uniref:Uncharacterized protein n=1 Tax=Peronospora matthiolae TaxID=2874970 RepID=A0AAV1T2B1_9STRA
MSTSPLLQRRHVRHPAAQCIEPAPSLIIEHLSVSGGWSFAWLMSLRSVHVTVSIEAVATASIGFSTLNETGNSAVGFRAKLLSYKKTWKRAQNRVVSAVEFINYAFEPDKAFRY